MSSKFIDGGSVNGCNGDPDDDTVYVTCYVCRCVIRFVAAVPVVEITNKVLCPCGGALWPVGPLRMKDVEVAEARSQFVPVDINPDIRGKSSAVPTAAIPKKPADRRYGRTGSKVPSAKRKKDGVKKVPSKGKRKKGRRPREWHSVSSGFATFPEASHVTISLVPTEPVLAPQKPSGANWKSWYYGTYLKSEWWEKLKEKILSRDNYTCRLCGCQATCVHHKSYDIDVLNGLADEKLVSLCGGCHLRQHPEKIGRRKRRKK